MSGDLVIVLTDDDFCRALSLEDLGERRSVRVGHAVKDVAMWGERLVVFDGRRGVCVYTTSGDMPLRETARYGLPKCGDLEIATCEQRSGLLTILYRGSRDAGDTLSVCSIRDESGLQERLRFPLPARVTAYYGRGLDLLLQLDGGLLLRLDLGALTGAGGSDSEGAADIAMEAAFLPVDLQAVTLEGTELIGIGERGVLVRGSLADFKPDRAGARVSRCGVTVLEIPPEE